MWRNVGEEREKRRGDKVSQICRCVCTCSARVWKLVTWGCLERKWTQTEGFSFCVSSFGAPGLRCSDWACACVTIFTWHSKRSDACGQSGVAWNVCELASTVFLPLHPTLSLFMSRCTFPSVQWYRRVQFSRKKTVLTWNCSQQGLGIILRNRVMISGRGNCRRVKSYS